ncbi:MAG: diacylglycerol kinase [Pseudomonadota bacterium]
MTAGLNSGRSIVEPFEKKGMEEKGLAHVFAAFGYSMAGLQILMKEEAARLELVLCGVAIVLFWFAGAGALAYAGLLFLLCLTLTVEALNTAIEMIVDKLSPEFSEFGKFTKDLGSCSVFFMLLAVCVYAAGVVFHSMGWIAW